MKKTFVAMTLGLLTMQNLIATEAKTFEAHKAQTVQNIEAHISRLKEHKKCIAVASTPKEVQGCIEKMKAWHEANQAKAQKAKN